MCDGHSDCLSGDESDEENCPEIAQPPPSYTCKSGDFRYNKPFIDFEYTLCVPGVLMGSVSPGPGSVMGRETVMLEMTRPLVAAVLNLRPRSVERSSPVALESALTTG